MTYTVKELAGELFGELGLDKQGRYFVAFSGGVDSTVLLHLMRELRDSHGFELTALHVSHNLQPQSRHWAQHCLNVCNAWDIPYRHTSLTLDTDSELAARSARYDWFAEQLTTDSVLLTAHHEQDRAETFLFNMMRGAGSTGLSSLRPVRRFHNARLVRPLLNLSQDQITNYAREKGLSWVEDPSNKLTQYSRNQIRHNVLPSLTGFRNDAIHNIARAAANLEQENSLLREVAIADLVDVREHPMHPIDCSYALCYSDIVHLSPARQANLLRFWLRSLKLHTPSKRFMARILNAIQSPPASTAVLQESGSQFRFYQGFMYVMPAITEMAPFSTINWQNVEQPLDLFHNKIRVDSTRKLRKLVSSRRDASVRLAARPEVENPKALQGHSLNLKKWLQEIGIPPWRRQALPLLTMSGRGNDVVLGPVDQQLHNDWVLLECPIS